MAGTVTITEFGYRDGLSCVVLHWVADSAGDATTTTDRIEGTIERVTFKPSPTSGERPTNLYDVTLKDAWEVDVLGAHGANLSNGLSSVSTVVAALENRDEDEGAVLLPTCGVLDLAVSNAGSGGTGDVAVYFRR